VCTVFRKEAWPAVWDRVKIPGVIALLVAAIGLWRAREAWWRRGAVDRGVRARGWLVGLGVFGFVWWLGVAVETQAGFSGNNRYLVLGTAPVAIAGGVAWGWFTGALAEWIRKLPGRRADSGRLGDGVAIPAAAAIAVVLLLALPTWIGKGIVSLPRTHHALVYQAHLRSDLTAAVAKAGGADSLLRCGPVMTEGFQVPMVAWTLGVHTLRIEATPSKTVGPPWPAVILQTRAQSTSHLLPTPAQIIAWEQAGARYRLVAHVRTFRVFSTCAGRVQG
jgi:hypothetical protein